MKFILVWSLNFAPERQHCDRQTERHKTPQYGFALCICACKWSIKVTQILRNWIQIRNATNQVFSALDNDLGGVSAYCNPYHADCTPYAQSPRIQRDELAIIPWSHYCLLHPSIATSEGTMETRHVPVPIYFKTFSGIKHDIVYVKIVLHQLRDFILCYRTFNQAIITQGDKKTEFLSQNRTKT